MGAAQSSSAKATTPAAQAAAGMTEAMKRCNAALQYLKTSESVLTVKRNKAKTDALEAFQRHERSEAAAFMRKANMAEGDLQTIRRRQLAIERQRSMIEQQQLNTMLTNVLVETSAALHTANTAAVPEGDHPADAVDQARERLEEVADIQAEIANSHADFDEVATTAGISAGAGAAEAALSDVHATPPAASIELEFARELKQLEELAANTTTTPQTSRKTDPNKGSKPKPPAPEPGVTIETLPQPPQTHVKAAKPDKGQKPAKPIII